MAIEKLSVILELVHGAYSRNAKEAATATAGISGAAKSVTSSLGLMIGPAAIGGAVVGLVNMAKSAGENADRLFDLQAQTGATTDQLQEFEFVAKAAGASQEFFSDAVKQVVKSLDTVLAGTGPASKAYEALGISVKDSSGEIRAAGDITEEAIAKLAGMTNITERNALAQDIFGKKWEETVSVLDMGTESIEDLRKEARDLGVVLGGDALRKADKFRESMDKLEASAKAAAADGLEVLLPLLIEISEEFQDAAYAAGGFFGLIDKGIDSLTGNAGAASAAREELDRYNSVFDFFLPNVTAGFTQLADLNAQLDANAVSAEAAATAARFMADAQKDDLIPVVVSTIAMLDNQNTSHRNVAKAADTQRTALINLADYQRSQLSPISNFIHLQEELATAQETLATAQANGETPASDLALAQLGVADAMLAITEAGLSLNAEEIQAFAQLLVTQFGYSEEAAQNLLEQLGLFDGFVANVKVNFEVSNASLLEAIGSSGINNTDIQVRHRGGVVDGPWGSNQLIVAQGGEGIIPLSQMGRGGSTTSNSRANNFYFGQQRGPDRPVDLQYLALLGNHQTFGKF